MRCLDTREMCKKEDGKKHTVIKFIIYCVPNIFLLPQCQPTNTHNCINITDNITKHQLAHHQGVNSRIKQSFNLSSSPVCSKTVVNSSLCDLW